MSKLGREENRPIALWSYCLGKTGSFVRREKFLELNSSSKGRTGDAEIRIKWQCDNDSKYIPLHFVLMFN